MLHFSIESNSHHFTIQMAFVYNKNSTENFLNSLFQPSKSINKLDFAIIKELVSPYHGSII